MQGFDLSTISDAYVGGTQVSAIYYCDTPNVDSKLIWPSTAPSEYADQYFTIESLDNDNEIRFGTYDFINRYAYWTSIENPSDSDWVSLNTNSYSYMDGLVKRLNIGEKIYIKGRSVYWNRNTGELNETEYSGGVHLDSTKRVKIYGNLSSLIEGKPVIKVARRLTEFSNFFSGLDVVDASNLYINVILSYGSFMYAFARCTSLVYPPSILYPTKMAMRCYYDMFYGCTSLKYPPMLPSKQLSTSCYFDMFQGCTSLMFAPELPATTLVDQCYNGMFSGCTSLTTAPALPATILADECYQRMFSGCTSLTTAPELLFVHSARFNNAPCLDMFSNCASLNKITCLYDPTIEGRSYEDTFRNWVTNISSTGTFYKRVGTDWPTGDSGIPYGWTIEDSMITVPLTITSVNDNNELYITNTTNNFAYSLDSGQTWSILQPNVHITFNANDSIQLLAANKLGDNKPTVDNDHGIGTIMIAERGIASGNVMSLLDGSYNNAGYYNFETMQEIPHDYQFKDLFRMGNSSLLLSSNTPLVLPATILKQYCYDNMLSNNYALNEWPEACVPELPATKLEEGCYHTMFGWTNILTTPELPAMILAERCYDNMFAGCWNLNTPPVLPATELKPGCYQYMFTGSAITTPPTLSVTKLAEWCYQGMFGNCTSLTAAPVLPAIELTASCYAGMFNGCTSLTTAPDLPATQLVWGCYREMFKNCSSLNSIKCMALDLGYSDWNSTTDWVDGVAASGTFAKEALMQNWTTGVDGIPSGWSVVNINAPYFTIESLSNNNNISYQSNVNNIFDYSTDGGLNWVTWSPNTNVTLNNGDRLLVRGTNPTVDSTYGIGTFNATDYFNVSGNIMSLVYGDNYDINTTITNYQFRRLFNGNTYLRNAQNLILPATTLDSGCYSYMFYGCTSLITAPSLPATTLDSGCYGYMFYGCTSLVNAPSLPATTLASGCYMSMLRGCTSLTTAPSLPATTLASSCYQEMFYGCTSLTTAPELPVTTLASSCYESMFYRCTSLTTAPALSATTLAIKCYASMFRGCTSLTTAPSLPATTLASGCYSYMFYGCTSLTTAPIISATTLAANCCSNMFNGCTSLVNAPTLSATTLADYCYEYMFYGCTSLTTAPALPATSTYDSGHTQEYSGPYRFMFYNCTSLNYVYCLLYDRHNLAVTQNWLFNVASNGIFVKNSLATWLRDVNGIPSSWTVQDAS